MGKIKFHKGLKANLPSTGLEEGNYYQCTDTGELFLATSATTKVLVATGTNIKTVNNQSLLGSGNIEIQGGGGVEEAPIDDKPYLRKNGEWISHEKIMSETVVLHISASEGTLPTPIPITVVNTADESVLHILSWVGSDLTFLVWGDTEYRIEFGKVLGYTSPSFTATAIADTQRNVNAEYSPLPNGVYIGYMDGSVSPYNQLISGKTAKGVVLKTDNVSLLLHPTQGNSVKWSDNTSTEISGVTTTTDRATALLDFAGKSNTDAVVASGLAGSAFTFATTLGSEWYLPSCGEMEQIRLNQANINTALGLIGGTTLDFSSKYYWSSTQCSLTYAWGWYYSGSYWDGNSKGRSYSCRAVCAF